MLEPYILCGFLTIEADGPDLVCLLTTFMKCDEGFFRDTLN